jgi:serine O-acetyltransferase
METHENEVVMQSSGVGYTRALEALAPAVRSASGRPPLPSSSVLAGVIAALKQVLFPEAYLPRSPDAARAWSAALATARDLLTPQVDAALAALDRPSAGAAAVVDEFLGQLPAVKAMLDADVEAALAGDPAVFLRDEVLVSYPSFTALLHHRLAHALHRLGVPLVPRQIAELAHTATGIDIHPGATIGAHFFIDHGTGVVIGETAEIGRNVRLYQGVTLGARSFPVNERGEIVKGAKRHPIIGDDVVIYAGAAVLGRVRVGDGSVIGGNVWVTRDVPAGSRVVQGRYEQQALSGHGDGI